ncbi:including n-acetylases of ribosomal protein [Neofusicoccum parvum]|uniref:Including n-acetylases of ribosomal protein n=1 Tax=Neofusicoccum parvum TaxID=310453 RepID=A0ACB5SPV7_9PEZI|nr:including n-acetylases of ribosomal protein [Neofusicoccum parvum]
MTDPNFHISTPRLYLSYFQPSNPAHCDFLVTLYNTPAFIASIGGKPTSITTRAAAEALLTNRFRAEHARNGYGTLLVSRKPDGATDQPDDTTPFPTRLAASTPIGTVSLMRGEPPNAYAAPDLGFAILPAETRRGYATEAARGLLAWAEEERGVRDVLGLFDPANEASKGVFRRLGFEDRGVRALRVFGGVEGAVWCDAGIEILF